jgi:hypothetical protein
LSIPTPTPLEEGHPGNLPPGGGPDISGAVPSQVSTLRAAPTCPDCGWRVDTEQHESVCEEPA